MEMDPVTTLAQIPRKPSKKRSPTRKTRVAFVSVEADSTAHPLTTAADLERNLYLAMWKPRTPPSPKSIIFFLKRWNRACGRKQVLGMLGPGGHPTWDKWEQTTRIVEHWLRILRRYPCLILQWAAHRLKKRRARLNECFQRYKLRRNKEVEACLQMWFDLDIHLRLHAVHLSAFLGLYVPLNQRRRAVCEARRLNCRRVMRILINRRGQEEVLRMSLFEHLDSRNSLHLPHLPFHVIDNIMGLLQLVRRPRSPFYDFCFVGDLINISIRLFYSLAPPEEKNDAESEYTYYMKYRHLPGGVPLSNDQLLDSCPQYTARWLNPALPTTKQYIRGPLYTMEPPARKEINLFKPPPFMLQVEGEAPSESRLSGRTTPHRTEKDLGGGRGESPSTMLLRNHEETDRLCDLDLRLNGGDSTEGPPSPVRINVPLLHSVLDNKGGLSPHVSDWIDPNEAAAAERLKGIVQRLHMFDKTKRMNKAKKRPNLITTLGPPPVRPYHGSIEFVELRVQPCPVHTRAGTDLLRTQDCDTCPLMSSSMAELPISDTTSESQKDTIRHSHIYGTRLRQIMHVSLHRRVESHRVEKKKDVT